MAFGRSNSLSINTGATNSLFASQQGNSSSSQPPAAGGLFGGSQQPSQSTGGGLFGQQQQSSQPQPTGGLFGGAQTQTQTSQPQQSGGLFGSSTQTSQPQQSGGLFGGAQTQQSSIGGGLFGGTSNTQAQPQTGGGLFGSSTQQQQPQQQSGGLFGGQNTSNMASGGGGLFGGSLGQQQQPQQSTSNLFGGAKPGGSLFGNQQTQPQQGTSSLFGNTTQTGNTGGLFGGQQQQQQQPQQQSVFGLSVNQNRQPTSLLNASQYRTSQMSSYSKKLTMGQPTSNTNTAQSGMQGPAKVNLDDLRPTTRFADCYDEVKKDLERMDNMIQAQEKFCRDIEAFLPKHGENVQSLAPDVDFVKEKADAAEYALAIDAQGVDSSRKVLIGDGKDFDRLQRVIDNLSQPPQYQHTGLQLQRPSQKTTTGTSDDSLESKDMDLIGNYFVPKAAELQQTISTFASNLSEIEAHMRILESSAVAQAQQLAAKRAGVSSGGRVSEDSVRELADTLRGFEAGILGAADRVGLCREGINGLVLGRVR